jgi:hypothetical protein
MQMQKMALRGQAFDSYLQCDKLVLDRLIKGGAIAGMEVIPHPSKRHRSGR